MQCVEPPPGLIDVFDYEISGEMFLEPLFVFEGIMNLSEWHGARFEPTVKDFRNAPHGAVARRVVGVWPCEIIDEWTMKVIRPHSEIRF